MISIEIIELVTKKEREGGREGGREWLEERTSARWREYNIKSKMPKKLTFATPKKRQI